MSDQPTVNLNVTDISDAVKVIDHACEQGAFRGWTNIRQILALRDRLDLFTTAAAAIPTEPVAEEAPVESDADVDADPTDTDIETEMPSANPRRSRHQSRQRARS